MKTSFLLNVTRTIRRLRCDKSYCFLPFVAAHSAAGRARLFIHATRTGAQKRTRRTSVAMGRWRGQEKMLCCGESPPAWLQITWREVHFHNQACCLEVNKIFCKCLFRALTCHLPCRQLLPPTIAHPDSWEGSFEPKCVYGHRLI